MTKYNAMSDKAKPVSTFMTVFAGETNVQVVITNVDYGLKYNQLHLHRKFKCNENKIYSETFFSPLLLYFYKFAFIFEMDRT